MPMEMQQRTRRVQILRQHMSHFVTALEQYTLIEVIQSQWVVFKSSLGQQTVFEDLIKLHNEFLDSIKHQSVDII